MPFNGLTSFLHARNHSTNVGYLNVSMPFNGLTSFLPEGACEPVGELNVSMPFNGLTSFLHKQTKWHWKTNCVSMPFNGLTSFLRKDDWMGASLLWVSMPFNGLTSFLHYFSFSITFNWCVSMPFNGLTSFLHAGQVRLHIRGRVCQCPLTGLLHFYPAFLEAPVYKASRYMFSPRFLKLLQKCYILPVFWFFWIFCFIYVIFYHIFLAYASIISKYYARFIN